MVRGRPSASPQEQFRSGFLMELSHNASLSNECPSSVGFANPRFVGPPASCPATCKGGERSPGSFWCCPLWAPLREDHLRLTLKAQKLCTCTHTWTHTYPHAKEWLSPTRPWSGTVKKSNFHTFVLFLRTKGCKSMPRKHYARNTASPEFGEQVENQTNEAHLSLPSLLLPHEWKGKREGWVR